MSDASLFLRLMAEEDKGAALATVLERIRVGAADTRVFQVAPESFRQVPGAPFAYWVSERVRRLFVTLSPINHSGRAVCSGPDTGQDFRCIRAWWECPESHSEVWVDHAKGGAYSPYYADIYLRLLWGPHGRYLSSIPSLNLRNPDYYLRPGLTWSLRTQSGLALRPMPAGCIFGHKGPAAFVASDEPDEMLALLAITNSRAFRTLVDIQMAFGSYEVGVIQRTPVPDIPDADRRVLADLAHRAWSLKRAVDTAELTSHAFVLPALLHGPGDTLPERAVAWATRLTETEQALDEIQAQIDERCFDLYGFAREDREVALGGVRDEVEATKVSEEEAEEDGVPADAPALAAALVDWLVGATFGRFDVRLAMAEHRLPAEPDPFDPLPVCSPGMLTDEKGMPVTRAPEGYPLELALGGILVDDPGMEGSFPAEWDIVRRARAALEVVFSDRAGDIEAELCQMLGVRELRAYLRRPTGFFADHLSRYSKSRRKAPIYWPLSTASGSYTVWIYYPRLTADTLYQVVSEHVAPKITEVESRITQLEADQSKAEGREASRLAKQLSGLAEDLDELKELREELLRVARLPYRPDLNDGVQITAAPLWRVFRLPKWRKDLEKTWKELESGKYDWAHLAYAIWSDRVKERCQTDKSLAIAHGLDELYEEKLGEVASQRYLGSAQVKAEQ